MDVTTATKPEDDITTDGPWALPPGWCWTRLGDVLPIAYGKALPDRDRTGSGEFAVFGSSGPVGSHDKYIAPPHSIMVGRKGSAGSVFYSEKPTWPIDTAYFTSGSATIDIRYGYWFLWFRKLGRLDQSTAIPSLSRDIYDVQPIPLAPLAEQRRIVARVEALFAEIDEGEAALAAARKGLETFRRALLKAAVTGELTKDWRAANPVAETGHDLLARIAKGRASQGDRARRVADAAPLDTSILPGLPSGWDWATLGGIAESVRNGTSVAPRAALNQHEILRISAVRPLRIDEAQIRFLDDDQAKAAAAATVEAGDLLFTRYNGSADLVGVGAIYRGRKRFYPDKIIRVRLEPLLSMLAEFVELAVNTGASRKHIAANIKTTAGQQGLSGESLKATPVPIPLPAEADEIVRRVSDALSACADTLALLDAEAADAARLRQSILKAAFEGRLVAQSGADEPATALLARLTANPAVTRAGRGRVGKSEA